MNLVSACLSIVAFMALLKLMRVDAIAREVLAISRRAVAQLRDPCVSDDVKERMARRFSLRLLGHFFLIVAFSAIAGGASFGVLALMDTIGLASLKESTAILTDWLFVTSVLAVWAGGYVAISLNRRRRRTRHEA